MSHRYKRLETEPTSEAIADAINNDTADRNEEIVSFIELLNSIDGPYCVLLDAPWGDGKTFFAKSVIQVLEVLNPQLAYGNDDENAKMTNVLEKLDGENFSFLPFYFNAWENDFSNYPLSALLASMAVDFDRMEVTKENSMKNSLVAIADATLACAGVPLRISNVVDAASGESLIQEYEKFKGLRKNINELAEESLPEVADKLVIFIDELDRCRPDFAVRLLEQVKSLFQQDNVIVVLSADSLQLAKAIGGMYGPGFDTQHFLERFFDMRVLLSHPDGFKVATGTSFQPTGSYYDLVVSDLLKTHPLTIRDVMRVSEPFSAGRNYVRWGDMNSSFDSVEKCIVIPLLIFIMREDTELFRAITTGSDYDALYSFGRDLPAVNELLDRVTSRRQKASPEVAETQRKKIREQYMHCVCVALFAANPDSQEAADAIRAVDDTYGRYRSERDVCQRLEFPKECFS